MKHRQFRNTALSLGAVLWLYVTSDIRDHNTTILLFGSVATNISLAPSAGGSEPWLDQSQHFYFSRGKKKNPVIPGDLGNPFSLQPK